MRLKTIDDIPKDWKVLTVRKKTTVKIRPSVGVERFKVDWSESELISDPELDVIVISEDGREYPCKMDIFFNSYSPLTEEKWIKKGTQQIVEIPEGTEPFEVETLEGVVGEVGYPDYVAIGVKGELYVNPKSFVDKDLEILGEIPFTSVVD